MATPTRNMLNLGPLTTTFTPPATCFSGYVNVFSYASSTYVQYFPYGVTVTCEPFGVGSSLVSTGTAPECYPNYIPPDATPYPSRYIYSPGAICPSGFSIACTETSLPFDNYLLRGETQARCCPSRYSCVSDVPICEAGTAQNQRISAFATVSLDFACASSYTVLQWMTTAQYSSVDGFHLVRQATDPPFIGVPTSSASVHIWGKTRLDVGLGVGIPALVACGVLIFLCTYCSRRKNKSATKVSDSNVHTSPIEKTPQELPAQSAFVLTQSPYTNLDPGHLAEAPQHRYPYQEGIVEMPSPQDPLRGGFVEMPSPHDPLRGGVVEMPSPQDPLRGGWVEAPLPEDPIRAGLAAPIEETSRT